MMNDKDFQPENWYPCNHNDKFLLRVVGLRYIDISVDMESIPISLYYNSTGNFPRRKYNPARVIGRSYRRSVDSYDLIMLVQYHDKHTIHGNKFFNIGGVNPEIYRGNVDGNWLIKILNTIDEPVIPTEWKDDEYISVEGEDKLVCLKSSDYQFNDGSNWKRINNRLSLDSFHGESIKVTSNRSSREAKRDRSPSREVKRYRPSFAKSESNHSSREVKKSRVDRISDNVPSNRIDKNSDKSVANNSMIVRTNYDLSDDILDCCDSNLPRIIHGPSGIGKTSLAKYMLDHKCVVIERMRDLNNYDPELHDGIIFENIDFSEMSHRILTSLLSKRDRSIKISGGNIILPSEVSLIFTTSIEGGKVFGVNKAYSSLYQKCYILPVLSKVYIDDESE